MDTIFALASARGKAGVAVVRLSGPEAHAAVIALCGSLPDARRASLRRLSWQDEALDEALVLIFDVGESFTGEASAELHLHGATAVVAAVLRALGAQPGLRLAEPGEFTRRALENGRLDLAQVEGLADLIEAETEAQRRQALRVLSGAVGRRAEGWRRDLIRAAALLEATIDFADEDVPVDVAPEVLDLSGQVLQDLRREAEGVGAAERIRDGYEVAIVGRPNAGKSTLLNALAGREAAITSEIAGTTRDVIEVRMDLGGLPVTFLDTAGLRDSDDRIEAIGIERALERARAADLRIFLLDGADVPLLPPEPEDLLVHGKADLVAAEGFAVSGKTGEGIEHLIAQLTERLGAQAQGAGLMIRERHKLAALRAIEALESARNEVRAGSGRTELAAEDLRRAIRALDSLVGRVDVEDLLDEIFASFCIGK
ncbi:tRNA uridine-5-carboxymethylaminomethyl(34) synthesis GTPase MnmE [Frigidibacter sp. RF13]|uniref:tRNA uridine-5-carboxymethylaminomethyl(34) synthesis GTPase MnmE n=1 Tax=Frigidibacter sp. RF13 TaxID=2997340 RepID=UPI00226FA455|nr:tRNA uridine-5-carboxymethylaminomethyl(34) synthesis GTPase MnmE [Frigidibacter sp. RF13]MCY1126432.1 tRNA uridine-5-carboxymethylaminomethyl(34) synthesis GTPase MnmE [Frigidibacter sp. RF13]